MKNWIRRWLFGGSGLNNPSPLAGYSEGPIQNDASAAAETPHVRVGVLEVMNGKLLEICTFKRNPHGPDWTTTYWILNDTQSLAEQIALVLTMKGLAK